MSESQRRPEKSSALASSVMVIVLLFVLYLATYPILFAYGAKRIIDAGSSPLPAAAMSESYERESWRLQCGLVYFWLASRPPLDEPMWGYLDWWTERVSGASLGMGGP
jgi:hypothetical protein